MDALTTLKAILIIVLIIMSAITVAEQIGINTRVNKKIIASWSPWWALFFCLEMIDQLLVIFK